MRLRRHFVALAAGTSTALVLGMAGTATAGSPPPTPFNFYVNNVTATSVSMQWSPGYITGPTQWRVFQNDVLLATRPNSAYVAGNLIPGETYSYRIVAVSTTGGASAPTRAITVTTRGPGVDPGAPSNLRAIEVAPARVVLEFDRPGDEFDVAVYRVFDGSTFVATAYPAPFAQPTASVLIRHLEPGSGHTYTVRAVRSVGLSAPSNTLAVTTPSTTDFVAPTVPMGLAGNVSRINCNEANLTWNQSTDNVDAAADIDYEVSANGSLVALRRGSGSAIVPLPALGANTVTVRAVDSSGNATADSMAITLTVDPRCEP